MARRAEGTCYLVLMLVMDGVWERRGGEEWIKGEVRSGQGRPGQGRERGGEEGQEWSGVDWKSHHPWKKKRRLRYCYRWDGMGWDSIG